MDSPLGRLTRRRATVTICAPDSSWACFMTSIDEYLPVPTMSRDENSLPPITRLVSYIWTSFSRPSSHGANDLDAVTFAQLQVGVIALGRDVAVDCDREVFPGNTEEDQQSLDRGPGLELHRLSVHRHVHK